MYYKDDIVFENVVLFGFVILLEEEIVKVI